MKLKRKTKKRFKICLAVIMCGAAALPLFEPFFPQNNQPNIADQYMADMLAQAADRAPVSDLNQNLEGYYDVVRVVDGDTVVIMYGEEEREFHLLGVDAPEIKKGDDGSSSAGIKAKEYLKNLIDGQMVGVEFDVEQEDKKGALLGYLYIEDVTQVNQLLVSEGWAKAVKEKTNVKYFGDLKSAQRVAKENQAGLWGGLWK